MITKVKTAREIAAMRESGRMLATVLASFAQKRNSRHVHQDLADIAASRAEITGR